MPVYEYECPGCGHRFEEIQRMDTPPPDCPICGAKCERLISRSAFHLKGPNWSKDGYHGRSKT